MLEIETVRYQCRSVRKGYFTLMRVLAASTRGKSHKSSFTIVYSHWRECSHHSHEYSRTLAVKTTCSLTCASKLAKKWTFDWNVIGNRLLFYLFCTVSIYCGWRHLKVIIFGSICSFFTYYLLTNLLIIIHIVDFRWKIQVMGSFVEHYEGKKNAICASAVISIGMWLKLHV